MTIAENLKNIRKERGMTQDELSKASGISRNSISEIETDVHSNTTIYVLCQLCRALKLTPNDIIPKEMYQ